MFFWAKIVRAVIIGVALTASVPASAETVRFYLEEADSSSFDVSGYFDISRSGSTISVGEFSVATGEGEMIRLSSTYQTDGFSYTDQNGSVGSFLAGPLYFQNNTVYSVDGFTATNPIRLVLWNQTKSMFNSYLDTFFGGGSITTLIGLTECFNCAPYREGGFATLTTIAPIVEQPDGGIGGEIPLPASAWLLLGGLGLLGAARKRKQK